jgi:hypothetical protein
MAGILILFLAVSMIGCSEFALDGMSHERAFQANGADLNSESNLPAIKALLARERQQFRAVSMPVNPVNRVDSKSLLQSSEDEVASLSASPASSSEDVTSAGLVRMLLLAPHPSTKTSQQAPQVRPLVPTTRSTADYSPQDRPAVPPYTFFAPTGSAYPGTIRCVPDYLGGQRCQNSP